MGTAGSSAAKSAHIEGIWQLLAGISNVGLGSGNVHAADQNKNNMLLAIRRGITLEQALANIGNDNGVLVGQAAFNVIRDRVIPGLLQSPQVLE